MKPMPKATVKYNPAKTLCEVQIGDSEDDTWGPLDATEAGHILVDEDTGEAYYLALTDDEGLTPETLYKLEPVTLEIGEDAEMEEEDEDGEEEEEGSGAD